MNTARFAERPLDAPVAPYNYEAERRYRRAYADAQREVLMGEGDYWPTNDWATACDGPRFDNEQYIPVMVAVQKAIARPDLEDADRWNIVKLAILEQAENYAEYIAGKQR